MSDSSWSHPQPVSDLDLAFGGAGGLLSDLMPPYSSIPAEFKRDSNPWVKWQMEWFFRGLLSFPEAKEGIDQQAALRHLSCIQRSFAPKHEHKQAAVAYLASLWLMEPT
jgi:hypothetical protein